MGTKTFRVCRLQELRAEWKKTEELLRKRQEEQKRLEAEKRKGGQLRGDVTCVLTDADCTYPPFKRKSTVVCLCRRDLSPSSPSPFHLVLDTSPKCDGMLHYNLKVA